MQGTAGDISFLLAGTGHSSPKSKKRSLASKSLGPPTSHVSFPVGTPECSTNRKLSTDAPFSATTTEGVPSFNKAPAFYSDRTC
ncbi:hypothetical protein L345_15930 [Ophiophagus hannah]|uniref:Uncharacterized protein n=1 Tax=Ophiophagus hannah TaxID=8665 RepID=V8N8T6_OPHHA|nr:hypothetical protein L345_15930 [Ophiophagus hannah]